MSALRFLKLTVAYDGTDYAGWQVQPNGLAVQQVLESAWKSVTGETLRITASGRTDAGVHALGQVCSLETESRLTTHRLRGALNAYLPDDIRILGVAEAPVNFHAIRDAVSKTYRYQIQDGELPDLFGRRYTWRVPQRLDIDRMRRGAAWLIGKHDFSAFQATGSDRRDAIRTVQRLDLDTTNERGFRQVSIEIVADGFLYNMVRNIVGTLALVGRGKQSPEWVGEVLAGRDRTRAGPTAPPQGLFLVAVEYTNDLSGGASSV